MTSEQYAALRQQTRQVFIRILIMSHAGVIMDELSGVSVSGSYDIDADSATRRSCTVEFVAQERLVPSPSSPFWINKRFQLFVGVKHLAGGEIVWFNQGIYVIQEPSRNISVQGSTISIQGLDLAAMQNGDISGQLLNNVKIEPGVPIHTALRQTMSTLGGESRFLIDACPYTVPYEMEYEAGSHVWDIVADLTALYMHYQSYYDENGYFVFSRTPTLINDSIVWDFEDDKLITSISETLDYANVKNYVAVWGRLKDDGSQAFAEISVRNQNYPNSPFTIEKLGEAAPRRLVVSDDSYTTNEQCMQRCEYEVYLHNNCADTIDVTCVPVYSLSVAQTVHINRPGDGIAGKYAIISLSCGLGYSDTMSFTAVKVY